MRSVRWLSASLGLCILIGLCTLTVPARGQFSVPKDAKLDAKEPTSEAKIKLGEMQRGTLRVKGPDAKSNLAILKQNAQFYVYRITYPEYYEPISSGDLKARPENKSVEGLIKELSSTLLFPVPENNAKFSTDQGDFIVEYGAALDEAIRTVLSKNPPILVRVNTARLLATASKSGAPAFAKTIGDLLTHKFFKIGDKFVQTPPEVYFHAIRAAEGLLGSYHPVWHLDPSKLTRHALKDDDLIPLVKIIMDIVQNGPTIMASAYSGEPVPPKLTPTPMQPRLTRRILYLPRRQPSRWCQRSNRAQLEFWNRKASQKISCWSTRCTVARRCEHSPRCGSMSLPPIHPTRFVQPSFSPKWPYRISPSPLPLRKLRCVKRSSA
jgi:hypothetical protein